MSNIKQNLKKQGSNKKLINPSKKLYFHNSIVEKSNCA